MRAASEQLEHDRLLADYLQRAWVERCDRGEVGRGQYAMSQGWLAALKEIDSGE